MINECDSSPRGYYARAIRTTFSATPSSSSTLFRRSIQRIQSGFFLKFSNFLNWLKSFRSKIHYKIEMRKYLKTRMKGALYSNFPSFSSKKSFPKHLLLLFYNNSHTTTQNPFWEKGQKGQSCISQMRINLSSV